MGGAWPVKTLPRRGREDRREGVALPAPTFFSRHRKAATVAGKRRAHQDYQSRPISGMYSRGGSAEPLNSTG